MEKNFYEYEIESFVEKHKDYEINPSDYEVYTVINLGEYRFLFEVCIDPYLNSIPKNGYGVLSVFEILTFCKESISSIIYENIEEVEKYYNINHDDFDLAYDKEMRKLDTIFNDLITEYKLNGIDVYSKVTQSANDIDTKFKDNLFFNDVKQSNADLYNNIISGFSKICNFTKFSEESYPRLNFKMTVTELASFLKDYSNYDNIVNYCLQNGNIIKRRSLQRKKSLIK